MLFAIPLGALVLAADGFNNLDTHFDRGVTELGLALLACLVWVVILAVLDRIERPARRRRG